MKLRPSELFGLRPPVLERWRQAKMALAGAEDVPPSRGGFSSLGQLRPRIGVPLWLGRAPVPRTVLITNLFNLTQTPVADGWSVRKTQVRDFRGGRLTYDSHNGTDFAIPVGTPVLAAAAGRVVLVHTEFNRGGLKIYIDHGEGLMTCSAHLGRALVREGELVEHGQPIAISAYSGIDGLITFPWGVPHVHFNVWLNGDPVCPFGEDEESMWLGANMPLPFDTAPTREFHESQYEASAVDLAIQSCRTANSRQRLESTQPLWRRGAHTIAEMNYYPTRFRERPTIYTERHPRSPRLSLPFAKELFDTVAFVDEL